MSADTSVWLAPLTASKSYKSQALRSLLSLGVGQGGKLFLQILSTVILARLLMPADFGLVAMAATVTNFIIVFKDAGLTNATVQQTTLTQRQVSTLFWLNILVGLGLSLATAASAPLLAYVYNEPALIAMVCVLAAGFFLGSLSSQHDALLRRRLYFTHIAVAEVLSLALGCGAAIFMALSGFGWWSLVAQKVVQMASYTIFCWVMCNWRPGFHFKWEEVKEQFAFGAHISTFNFMNYFSRNGDNILIGWYWGAGPLGIYAKAYDLLLGPLLQITGPLGNMMTPLLGRLRDEPARYRAAFQRVMIPANLLMLPIASVLFVFPEATTRILLGPSWGAAVPVISWLGLALTTQLIGSSTGWLLISQKRGADFARLGIYNSIINLVTFASGLTFGIAAVAAAYAITGFLVRLPLVFNIIGKSGPISARDMWKTLELSLWSLGIIFPGLLALRFALAGTNSLVQLISACAASGILLVVAVLAVPEGRQMALNLYKSLPKRAG